MSLIKGLVPAVAMTFICSAFAHANKSQPQISDLMKSETLVCKPSGKNSFISDFVLEGEPVGSHFWLKAKVKLSDSTSAPLGQFEMYKKAEDFISYYDISVATLIEMSEAEKFYSKGAKTSVAKVIGGVDEDNGMQIQLDFDKDDRQEKGRTGSVTLRKVNDFDKSGQPILGAVLATTKVDCQRAVKVEILDNNSLRCMVMSEAGDSKRSADLTKVADTHVSAYQLVHGDGQMNLDVTLINDVGQVLDKLSGQVSSKALQDLIRGDAVKANMQVASSSNRVASLALVPTQSAKKGTLINGRVEIKEIKKVSRIGGKVKYRKTSTVRSIQLGCFIVGK